MKRKTKACQFFSVILLLTSFTKTVERQVTKKTLDIYEKSSLASTLDCYFLDDIDDPYVMISDLMKYRMSQPFENGFPVPDYSLSYKRQVLTATNTFQGKEYTIEFDAKNDEIRSQDLYKATDIFNFASPHDFC